MSIFRRWRTCSSAVANSVIVFVIAVLTLVLGAGAETLLPKFLGVGFPVLLAAVQFMAIRRSAVTAVLFALAAGAMEDSLSSLPALTSASYFLALAVVVRWSEMLHFTSLFAYPVYQVWLLVWTGRSGGGVFGHILLALPLGIVTTLAVEALLGWAERRAAVDEAG